MKIHNLFEIHIEMKDKYKEICPLIFSIFILIKPIYSSLRKQYCLGL